MTEVPMIPTLIAEQWTLLLPAHRADRGVWPDGPHEGEPLWNWWERERLEDMHARLKPGDLVIDVGAEEGDMSALYASWGCRVFLAEPNPLVWPNIRAIFEANAIAHVGWLCGFFGDTTNLTEISRADIVASAIPELCVLQPPPWEDPERWDEWPSSAYGEIIGDHGFLNLSENDDPERVTPSLRMDDMTLAQPIDAITIDVEGSELRVLRGARETLERHHPMLWVSVHPEFMADMYGDTPKDIFDLLVAELGYHGRMLADVHEQHWVFLHPDCHNMDGLVP